MGRHTLHGYATLSQSGNVFFALFGAVGLVGVLGASAMTIMKGPVRAMQNVTQKTVAENQMIAGGRLSLIGAAKSDLGGGDCDGDGYIEPVPWVTTGTGTAPVGGGFIPPTLGAARQDPWGNTYGYCIWDHGTKVADTGCGGASQKRLRGTSAGQEKAAIAIISSGANRTFETTCGNDPTYITRVANSDDVIMEYTYAESGSLAGDLWNIKTGAPEVAEIAKNLEVKNTLGDVVFGVDSTTDTTKPSIKVDFVQKLTPAKNGVEFLSNIILGTSWLSGDGGNEGVFVNNNGYVGINEGAPSHVLTIKGTGGANDDMISYSYGNTASASVIRGYKARGTEAAKTLPIANDYFMTYGANGWDGSAWQGAGDIHTRAFTDWATEQSSYMQFNTRVAGTTAERMRIHGNGNVGIGNIVPSQLLTVGAGTSGAATDMDMIEVRSRGNAGISILGDYGNLSGETGGAFLRLSIDGNTAVTSNWGGFLSAVQNAGEDGTGGTYTDTLGNSILLGSKGAMPLQLGTAGSVTMTVTTDNKVGLGTTAPSVPLHLNYNNDITAIGTGGSFMIGTVGGGNFIMDNNELQVRSGLATATTMVLQNFGGNLTIGPSGTSRFTYAAGSGNVGLGGVTPTQKLHVDGNALVTDNIGVGGFISAEPTGAYGLKFIPGTGAMYQDVSSATYDIWLQGSSTTPGGTTRNLALLGRTDTDILYVNYPVSTNGGEYSGGTVIGGPVKINGDIAITGDITATGTGLGDNLGNHIATKALAMGSFKITGLATPTTASDAATKAYVDLQAAGAADNLGNHTATAHLRLGAYYLSGDGGAEGILVGSTGIVTTSGDIIVNGSVKANPTGDLATLPSYSWNGDTDTGMWRIDANQIGMTTGGVNRVTINSAGINVVGDIVASSNFAGNSADTVTAPAYSWGGNTDTGMWQAATDVVGITANGTESVRFYSTYLHMMSHQIKNVAAPTSANDAATKAYVDANAGITTTDGDARYLRLSGGTLTGNLWFTAGATRYIGTTDAFSFIIRTNNTNALTINSSQNATFAGSVTIGGTLAMGGDKITGLGTPTASTDAATKAYVDSKIGADADCAAGNMSMRVIYRAQVSCGGNSGAVVGSFTHACPAAVHGQVRSCTYTASGSNVSGTTTAYYQCWNGARQQTGVGGGSLTTYDSSNCGND